MIDAVKSVLEMLTVRGRQRGFLMVGEVQQELEEARAPAEAFDSVFVALKEEDIDIREGSEDALFDTAMSSDELVHVSDPVRM